MSLGREIKKARIDKGWKQQDLQAATGLSQKYLSAVELDKAQPSFDVVKRIARALAVSLDTLAKDEETPAPEPPVRPTSAPAAATPQRPSRKAAQPTRATARRMSHKAAPVG
jgi:transcriptional regulator with XRE-family HTH domain